MVFTAVECPKCYKKAVFPTNKKVIIDGEVAFPLSAKCSECGWEPTDEQVIEGWKTGTLDLTGA
ncbi:MAG: hypothetical protein FJY85_07730 [Deltaproteobacteria bacterium]|nr:hypothetical protein [Deltaproteobacteria bacterium]